MSKPDRKNQLIEHHFRQQYGRLLSYLTYLLGPQMLDYAEDITQDTLEYAFKTWRDHEIPEKPAAWLLKVARNKAFNLIKREKRLIVADVSKLLQDFNKLESEEPVFLQNEIEDSVLRMFFTCCSAEIKLEDQVALILNTLCGFSRLETAQALLLQEETVKKRLFRVKQKIRSGQIPLSIPSGEKALRSRLNGIKNTLYLMFNKGYHSYSGDQLIQKDVCLEAMRLCKLIMARFGEDLEARALMALMCYHTARFDSRIDSLGAIITLEDQDRSNWNPELIKMGHFYLSEASVEKATLSSYHIEAHIAALHCRAKSLEQTDWEKLKTYYSWLHLFKPSAVVKINLAIVESMISGSSRSIEMLNLIEKEDHAVKSYHLFYATRGHFYQQEGSHQSAILDFEQALVLNRSTPNKQLLQHKLNKSRELLA